MAQTHWKKLTNPNYLGAYSIEDGKPLVLTIRNVKQEVVIGSDGKKEECIVCYFKEDVKPMILNVTNCKTIEKITGTPYIEQWSGNIIQISVKKVKAFGDVVDALRVDNKVIKAKKAEPIVCENCGREITAIGTYSAEDIARINKERYGKKLCGQCSKELQSPQNNTEEKEQDQEDKAE